MDDSTFTSKADVELINEFNVEHILGYMEEHMAKGANYIDSILSYAEEHNIDIDVVGEIVRESPILMASVHEEAESLNLIEKIARLPI